MPALSIGNRRFSIEIGQTVTVGRGRDCDVQIDEPTVSLHHAEIRHGIDGVIMRDLDSTNGTKVNGKSVTQSALNPNDRISFGGVDAQYSIQTTLQAAASDTPQSVSSFQRIARFALASFINLVRRILHREGRRFNSLSGAGKVRFLFLRIGAVIAIVATVTFVAKPIEHKSQTERRSASSISNDEDSAASTGVDAQWYGWGYYFGNEDRAVFRLHTSQEKAARCMQLLIEHGVQDGDISASELTDFGIGYSAGYLGHKPMYPPSSQPPH